ncbi:TonB-dependent receptor domain-containing protein [Dyella sp. A6]|uniref:TonB-dependent receptor domain-containing protein n=1 Tax=Dyella aluminiiresistens TaxID=3069105 RepID=UPI002E775B17|nr:TonB-dependent receptor [Dyella sp. A6]
MLKSKLTLAVVAALALGCTSAYADDLGMQSTVSTQQDASSAKAQATQTKKAKKLQTVVVTGSLIPQSEIETSTPVTTITAEDIKANGFATVAEALQQSSFATGSVQGSQFTNSFTPTAQTLSMFGLPVGFVKYLIDGRPMGNFPGLYNGSDTFNSLNGIPTDLVDHIDILPGGQSSIYGSDAIAGVVNIVLKKHVDAPAVDLRYGWDSDGGGADRRVSFADSFHKGRFNSLVGVQFESQQPIWRRDRSLTRQFNQDGTGPQTASRDYLVLGYFSHYLFLDPNNCSGLTGQWYGTERKQYRKGSGYYCGSMYTPGYGTLTTGKKEVNFYTHSTFDVNDNLQLYGDLLYTYEEQKYTNGASTTWWGSSVAAAAAGGGYFWDPRMNDFMLLQHAFSPEEVGGYKSIMSKETENAYMLTLGGRGTFGQSNWDYDASFTHSDDHLLDRDFQRFTTPMETYFANHVMGPMLGTYYGYPVYEPNYAGLYNPVSNSDFRKFTGYTDTRSKTWDNLVRVQFTNDALFTLPGGDAGVALVAEAGNEGWDITPDPRLLEKVDWNGTMVPYVWGTSATPGAGHRTRYATTAEMRLPVFSQLTFDISGRYDSYGVQNQRISHKTYNIGVEYRPFSSLLLRARYGTAFKAPTLSDEFQRPSAYYNSVPDYLNCARLGYDPSNITSCPSPYNSVQYKGETYGNPALQPITAKVWTYGVVWSPTPKLSFNVDYLHFGISNEVNQVSADQLSLNEYQCEAGILDSNSATCARAFEYITRGPGKTANGVALLGNITNITTLKFNVANEEVNAIDAGVKYLQDLGSAGRLMFNLSYSDLLKHTYQDYPTDPTIDLLRHPGWSTDFRSKVNASLTWSRDKWSATLYANRYGSTPNYKASVDDSYAKTGDGTLAPWIIYNASVKYNVLKNLSLSFMVNNLFNKMPPKDGSYPGTTGTPYNIFNYNVYGRAMYLEANYKFSK